MSLKNHLPRGKWVYALTAVSKQKLLSVVEEACKNWEITPKSLPQNGLGMLKLKDSSLSENFFLGEFSVSSAHIVITQPDGTKFEGASIHMSNDLELTENLAICDAILANEPEGWENIAGLLREGSRLREKSESIRKAMLTQTKVDFSLLDAVEEDQ